MKNQLESAITDAKGVLLSYDRWGKYRLAYPVRKYEYGVYFLIRFEAPKENLPELLKYLRNYFDVIQIDLVMRHMIVKLDENKSLEYKRPESLEDTPSRDVDTFLKENKMSGLLNSSKNNIDELESADEEDEEN